MIVWPHVLSAAAAAVLVTAGAGPRPTTTTATGGPPYAAGALGQDISYPQCDGLPSTPVAFGIVGVTHGRPFTQNPCLGAEAAWARSFRPEVDVYFNLDYSPADAAAHGGVGPAGLCGDGDPGCLAYNYGSNTAEDAIAYAASQQVAPRIWWLDVETGNNWADDVNLNNAVINGAIAAMQHHGVTVGVYSAAFMWASITGGVHNGLPAWVAGPASLEATPSYCSPAQSFTGGPVWLVQYPAPVDGDYACGGSTRQYLVTADGGVFAAALPFRGSAGDQPLNAPVVGIATTRSGNGYWLMSADGGIFAYGDAAYHGSLGANGPPAPAVGIAVTASGNGYWLATADGGVYTYGDAAFQGSLGGLGLAAPIVGIAATASGNGYWLVSSDGGIFTTATPSSTARWARVGSRHRSSASPSAPRATATGWPRPTAGCSPTATLAGRAVPAEVDWQLRWSASAGPPTAAGTGSPLPAAG